MMLVQNSGGLLGGWKLMLALPANGFDTITHYTIKPQVRSCHGTQLCFTSEILRQKNRLGAYFVTIDGHFFVSFP